MDRWKKNQLFRFSTLRRFLILRNEWLHRFKIIQRYIILFLKRIHLPGFRGVSLYRVIVDIIEDVSRADFTLSASAMAYSFVLAIFPALIFAFSLVPYIPVENLKPNALKWFAQIMPPSLYDLLFSTIDDIFNKKSIGFLSIYFVTIIFLATRGIISMLNSLNTLDETTKNTRRSVLKTNLISIYMLIVLMLLTILGLGILVGSEIVLYYFLKVLPVLGAYEYHLFSLLKWLINYFIFLTGVSFVYTVAPVKKHYWSFFSPGSVLTSGLMLLALVFMRDYFAAFANYNKLYGTLGAGMMLLVWFFYISLVLLFGFALNCNIELHVLESNKLKGEKDTETKNNKKSVLRF